MIPLVIILFPPLRSDRSDAAAREIFEADIESEEVHSPHEEDPEGEFGEFFLPVIGDLVEIFGIEAKGESAFVMAVEIGL